MFPVVTSVMSHRFHQGIFLHIAAIAAIAIRAIGGILRRRFRVHLFRLVGERAAVGRVGFERGFGPFLIHKDLVGAWPNQRKNGEKWSSPTTNTYQTLKEVQKLLNLSGRLLRVNKDRGLGRNNILLHNIAMTFLGEVQQRNVDTFGQGQAVFTPAFHFFPKRVGFAQFERQSPFPLAHQTKTSAICSLSTTTILRMLNPKAHVVPVLLRGIRGLRFQGIGKVQHNDGTGLVTGLTRIHRAVLQVRQAMLHQEALAPLTSGSQQEIRRRTKRQGFCQFLNDKLHVHHEPLASNREPW